MEAKDFDLEDDLDYGAEPGVNSFRNSRVLTLNAQSLGLLRQQLVEALGAEDAREQIFRFGFQSGYADYLHIEKNYEFETADDLLQAGPKIHTDKGIVAAEPKEMDYDREEGEFYFSGVWHNSYEAEQHLIYNGESDHPICWSLMGYASAWCSGFASTPVFALESKCVGMGDDVCKWEVKPIDEWGPEADPFIFALEDIFVGEKLMKYYTYIEEQEGLAGKRKLAKETNMPAPLASTAVDSKDNIEIFRNAVEKITGERPPHL